MEAWKGPDVGWAVIDKVALTHMVDSAERAGSAAENAERKKTEKYSDLGSQYLFYPVGLENFGTWDHPQHTYSKRLVERWLNILGRASLYSF